MSDGRVRLPDGVLSIIGILEKHGFEAYAVGGCVRDSLIGREPGDWDITTNASPSQAKSIFHRTIDTGIEHGTITVRMKGQSFELTTYRVDGAYTDGRHPDKVQFVPSLKEDLRRRDFTINAMAYHPKKGLVDLFGGRDDLKNGVIRCVGNAKERFLEDALRMLRALRFSAQLGFTVEEKTANAAAELHERISLISKERIRMELEKLLLSPYPDRLLLMSEWGLSSIFLPEWDDMLSTPQHTVHHHLNVGEHTIEVIKALPKDRHLRLAGFLHDVAKPIARKTDKNGEDHFVGHPFIGEHMAHDILRRLKYDNETIRVVSKLVLFHDERPKPGEKNIRFLASRVGAEHMEMLFSLKQADIEGQSSYQKEEKRLRLCRMKEEYKRVRERGDALSIRALSITGKDLIHIGAAPGPMIGRLLEELFSEVIEEPSKNEREKLLTRASELLRKKSKKVLVLLLCFLFTLSGCSFPSAYDTGNATDAASASNETIKDRDDLSEESVLEEELSAEEELAAEAEQEYSELLQDDYMVMDWSDGDERVILKSLTTDRQYRFAFGLETKFLDKWGNRTSQTNFTKGSIVKLGGVSDNMLSSISLSGEAWVIEGLRNFSIKKDKETFLVGKTKYRLRPTVSVFSKDRAASIDDITEDDKLKVVGKGKNVLSITVETGHGYISLMNTDFFNDSLISIGTKIHSMLSGDTVVSVPEGKYRVTVAKNGYGGSAKVKVKRDETVYLDLSTLKGEGPKKCKLRFVASVDGVKAFIDGKKTKVNKKVEVNYGEHTLRVEVRGYQPWQKRLFVNSPSARISLDPTEESIPVPVPVESSSQSSSSNQNTGTNSSNTNNSTNTNSRTGTNNASGTNSSTSTNDSTSAGTNRSVNSGSTTTTRSTAGSGSTTGTTTSSDSTTGSTTNTGNTTGTTTNTGNTAGTSANPGNSSSYGGATSYTGADYGAGTGGNNTNAATQSELDYLDTLSNMIRELTDQ